MAQPEKLDFGISFVFGLTEQWPRHWCVFMCVCWSWGRWGEKVLFLLAEDAQSNCRDLEYRHNASVTNERLHIIISKLCFELEMKK